MAFSINYEKIETYTIFSTVVPQSVTVLTYIRNIMLFYVNLVKTKINYFAPAIKRSPLSLFLDHFFVVLGGVGGGGIKGTS